MTSSWPVISQLRRLLGIQRGPSTEGPGKDQRFNLQVDLAEMGSNERVQQLKQLEREFQRMLEDAADAYKNRLRPGS